MKLNLKADFARIWILMAFSIVMWVWVSYEYSKPDGIDWRSGTLNSRSNAIEIIEVGDKKIVRNKKDRFEFSAPISWATESASRNKIVLRNSQCKINFEIAKEETTLNTISKNIKENFDIFTIKNYQEKFLQVANRSALEIFLNTVETGISYSLFIIDQQKVYSANLYLLQESNDCLSAWEDFKQTFKL